MIKFIKKIILFGILPIAAIIVCVVIYGTAIPNVSNSLSFNAKMYFMKSKKLDTTVHVIAVGSSMTLNNIHSATIAAHFDNSYINTASWGQSIVDDYKLIKIFTPLYKPETIIITSNFMDFQNEWSKIKFELLDSYLSKTYTKSGFDLRYNIKNAEELEAYMQNQSLYNYLNYDDHGGVNLDAQYLITDSLRWKGRAVDESPLDPIQYAYLDSISNFCNSNKISLIFVQSPFRVGYYSQMTSDQKAYLNNHVKKVDSILGINNQFFINTLDNKWSDELFVDYSHLNKEGSEVFTHLFLEKVDKTVGRIENWE